MVWVKTLFFLLLLYSTLTYSVELNDEEAVKKFMEDAGASLILFLNDAESSSDNTKKQAFMEVAREFKDEYPFGIVEDKKILEMLGRGVERANKKRNQAFEKLKNEIC